MTAGTRARHAYDLGSQLGLPTGLMATLGGGVSEQNAMMISALMGRFNAVWLTKEQFPQLAGYLAAGSPVVVTGSPPYHWWEPPPSEPIVLEMMANARLVNQIQLINGLKPHTITQALQGESVGTVIYAD